MKDTFYFSHDYSARSDIKIKKLLAKHGLLGYGVYWAIVEDLYMNANALPLDCDGIAYDLRIQSDLVESVINDFDLFQIEDNEFGSLSVQKRLDERDKKSKKARESARKRWDKEKKNANALQTECEPNAIKERKGKEIKGKDSKEKEVVSTQKKTNTKKPLKNETLIPEEKHTLQTWIEKNSKYIKNISDQLTFEEATRLIERYPLELIKEKVIALENKKNCHKSYSSVYLTINNWCRMATEKFKPPVLKIDKNLTR